MGDILKTQEQHEKEVFEVWGNDITVIEKYKGNRVKIKYHCNKCGKDFEKDPYNLIKRKQGCTFCRKGTRLGKNKDWFQEKLDDKWGKGIYTVLEYKTYETPCKLLKNDCNHIINPIPSNVINCKRDKAPCAICYGHLELSYEEIKVDIETNGYTLLTSKEEYINSDRTQDYVKLRHNECGSEYDVLLKNFRAGNRCPNCAKDRYKGEKEIARILSESNIIFERHYTGFDDCKNIKVLEYDFYLPKYNAVIEFDGRFHFESMTNSDYSRKKFEGQQVCDCIKNKYCEDNNIPILRIKYTNFNNMEELINDFLDKLESNDY